MIQEQKKKEYFNAEDLRYLRVAITLALGNDDSLEMPRTSPLRKSPKDLSY